MKCWAGEPGGNIGAGSANVSGSSRGSDGPPSASGSGRVPSRAAGGGLAQLATGPASITLPAGDRLAHSGTPAVHGTSTAGGGPSTSARQRKTEAGPTGGPPFGTLLIDHPTCTRPPNPVGADTPRPRPI